ncbi:hydrogenase expression/formation protein HypD [Anaerosolibacter carboniphilus]|uniref:Hydrogenase expression/formation protein HypD n=1 Tax=Anaerosolibacter carboniphilus TaxID=1417629 RepID=A0A841L1V7_9FIRM|nr:hydrogenase formation protein HypD [Anaerosolibacter carboniphilus]MBB6218608.1 hydrogenase expression/formation protein HypD [Anaerosolibacter carboniphilus]
MNENLISRMIKDINENTPLEMKIMEVCGTHTHAIGKYGIRTLVDSHIQLLSGPGCPVCVTPESVIDAAIQILENDNIILATFGDLVKVTGSTESILDQRRKGKNISILYTPFEALEIAQNNRDKIIVFLAVGFETTAPVIASTIKLTKERNISNLYFLNSLRLMPPVLRLILNENLQHIHGMICPGHVAAVMGEEYFQFIEQEYDMPAAIAGFDALDIVSAIHKIMQGYRNTGQKNFENLYKRSVRSKGNLRAKDVMNEVFETSDGEWRGIGYIRNSSLVLKENYSEFDALERFGMKLASKPNHTQCICKEILMGHKKPIACDMFGSKCNPTHPLGPCMVSSEGSCASYYRYQL